MKLASYKVNGRSTFGVITQDSVSDLGQIDSEVPSLRIALEWGKDWIKQNNANADCHALDDIEFLPVIPDPEKVIGIGINTKSHFEEARSYTGLEQHPQKPWLFIRPSNSLVGHKQNIKIPTVSDWLDYESELAVIIGKHARNVSTQEAMDYVAGFSCFNDGSIRDYQIHTPQITAGKIFPKTGGFGPWLTLKDDIEDVNDIKVELILNDEVMQSMTMDDLIIPIPELISYCSQVTELKPGDVIVTGSPEGIGALKEPRLWLKEGDEVVVDIKHVGRLVNGVERD